MSERTKRTPNQRRSQRKGAPCNLRLSPNTAPSFEFTGEEASIAEKAASDRIPGRKVKRSIFTASSVLAPRPPVLPRKRPRSTRACSGSTNTATRSKHFPTATAITHAQPERATKRQRQASAGSAAEVVEKAAEDSREVFVKGAAKDFLNRDFENGIKSNTDNVVGAVGTEVSASLTAQLSTNSTIHDSRRLQNLAAEPSLRRRSQRIRRPSLRAALSGANNVHTFTDPSHSSSTLTALQQQHTTPSCSLLAQSTITEGVKMDHDKDDIRKSTLRHSNEKQSPSHPLESLPVSSLPLSPVPHLKGEHVKAVTKDGNNQGQLSSPSSKDDFQACALPVTSANESDPNQVNVGSPHSQPKADFRCTQSEGSSKHIQSSANNAEKHRYTQYNPPNDNINPGSATAATAPQEKYENIDNALKALSPQVELPNDCTRFAYEKSSASPQNDDICIPSRILCQVNSGTLETKAFSARRNEPRAAERPTDSLIKFEKGRRFYGAMKQKTLECRKNMDSEPGPSNLMLSRSSQPKRRQKEPDEYQEEKCIESPLPSTGLREEGLISMSTQPPGGGPMSRSHSSSREKLPCLAPVQVKNVAACTQSARLQPSISLPNVAGVSVDQRLPEAANANTIIDQGNDISEPSKRSTIIKSPAPKFSSSEDSCAEHDSRIRNEVNSRSFGHIRDHFTCTKEPDSETGSYAPSHSELKPYLDSKLINQPGSTSPRIPSHKHGQITPFSKGDLVTSRKHESSPASASQKVLLPSISDLNTPRQLSNCLHSKDFRSERSTMSSRPSIQELEKIVDLKSARFVLDRGSSYIKTRKISDFKSEKGQFLSKALCPEMEEKACFKNITQVADMKSQRVKSQITVNSETVDSEVFSISKKRKRDELIRGNNEDKAFSKRNVMKGEEPNPPSIIKKSPSKPTQISSHGTSVTKGRPAELPSSPKRVRFIEPSQPLRTSGRNVRLLQLMRRRQQRSLRKMSWDGPQDLSLANANVSGPDKMHRQELLDELQYLLDGVFKHEISTDGKTNLVLSSLHSLVRLFLRKDSQSNTRDAPCPKIALEEDNSLDTLSEQPGVVTNMLVSQPQLLRKIVKQLCAMLGKSRAVDALIALLLVIVFRSSGTTSVVSPQELDLLLNAFMRNCASCLNEDDLSSSSRKLIGKRGDEKKPTINRKRGIFANRTDDVKDTRKSIDTFNELVLTAGVIEEDTTNTGTPKFVREKDGAAYLLGAGLAIILSAVPGVRAWMRDNRRLDRVVAVVYSAEALSKKWESKGKSNNARDRAGWRIIIGGALRMLQFAALDEICQSRIIAETRVVAIAIDVVRGCGDIRIGSGLDSEWVLCNALKLCINLMRGSDEGSSSQFAQMNGPAVVLDCLVAECIASKLLDDQRDIKFDCGSKDIGLSDISKKSFEAPSCFEESFDVRVLCLALLASSVDGDLATCEAFPTLRIKRLRDGDTGALDLALEILAKSGESADNSNGNIQSAHEDRCIKQKDVEMKTETVTGEGERRYSSSGMERKITIGYVCLLVGALVRRSTANHELLLRRLSRDGLHGIAEVLQEFLEFHHEVGIVSNSIDEMYEGIITALTTDAATDQNLMDMGSYGYPTEADEAKAEQLDDLMDHDQGLESGLPKLSDERGEECTT